MVCLFILTWRVEGAVHVGKVALTRQRSDEYLETFPKSDD